MSRDRDLEEEIASLQESLRALQLRVETQEDELQQLRSSQTEDRSNQSTSSFEAVGEEPGPYSWPRREEVAREIGAFLRRSLNGENRGSSGRDKVSLQNRVYIVVRDIDGRVYDPIRLETKFHVVKGLCHRAGSFGDSIFIGLPSHREAFIATRAAGLRWPPPSP